MEQAVVHKIPFNTDIAQYSFSVHTQ